MTLEGFVRWAEGFGIEDAPDDVVEGARLQVCNALAAAYSSLDSDGGDMTSGVRDRAPDGDATAIGPEDAPTEADAATAYYINSVLSMHHDYDDYLFMAHSGHSAVLASLAVAEENGLSGAELLEAVVIANELEGRLGASVVVGPHNGQMWSFVHQAGAAAVTASLEGTDVGEAVSLALYNPPFPLEPGFMGGDSKSLTATTGCAGIRAARLASSGATGEPDIMGAQKGFLDRFSYLPFPEVVSGFGDSWVTRSLSYKPYPGCAYIQTPVELVEGMSGFDADEVTDIRVESSLLTCGMEEMSRPHRSPDRLPPSNVTFSVPYSVAVALHADGYATDALSGAYLRENRDAIDELASKVGLEHGWRYTVDALEGMSRGVPLDSLLAERSIREKISGLRRFREEHSRVSTRREVARLVRSGEIRGFLGSLSSDVGSDGFDMSEARFDDLEFRFGASVEVRTEDDVFTAEATDHSGASGRDADDIRSVVYDKLRDAAPEGVDADGIIDTVDDIEKAEVSELTGLL